MLGAGHGTIHQTLHTGRLEDRRRCHKRSGGGGLLERGRSGSLGPLGHTRWRVELAHDGRALR